MYNLGWMHEYGRGVPEDVNKAVKWYRMAAERGDKDAKERLRALMRE